ncbi:hypothetical protein FJV46_01085 [Arthrobacter agilis]|nr:hypothetical protein FJV46_01085 [Arthrobacter agilis]
MMFSALSGTVPLVGRSELLGTLEEILRRGEVYGACVHGATGTGKSAMARHLLTLLQGEFVPFLVTPAPTLGSIPYGALTPFLLDATAEDMASPLSVLRRVLAFFRTRAGGRPVIVLVDDAHLLDDDSSHLLSQLATSRIVRLAAFTRTTPSSSDELASLCRDGLLERFEVGPLDYAEAHELCVRVLGAGVVRGTSDWFCDEASGNPLFLKAVLDEALLTGSLSKPEGIWTVAPRTVTVPRALEDLVRATRLELDGSEQVAFDVVALNGMVAFADLATISSEPAVAGLMNRGLIRSVPDHPAFAQHTSSLYARITRGLTPMGRSVSLFRLLTERTAPALPVPPPARIQHGLWSLDCGMPLPDEALLELSRVALTLPDPAAALQLAGAVRSRVAASLCRAEALLELADVERARQVSTGLLEAAASPDEVTAAGVLEARLLLAEGRGAQVMESALVRWGHALRTLGSADPDAVTRSEDALTVTRASVLNLAGRYSEAVDALQPFLAVKGGTARVVVEARILLAEALGGLGRSSEALQQSERALAGMVAAPAPDLYRQGFLRRLALLVHSGDFRGAERVLRGYDPGAPRDYAFVGGPLTVLDAAIDVGRGRFGSALATLRPALASLRTSDRDGMLPYALGLAAWAGAALDEGALVREYCRELDDVEHGGGRQYALLARGFCAAARHLLGPDSGTPALVDLAEEARGHGWPGCEKTILELAMWLGDDRCASRLAEVAASLEGPEAAVVHAYASAAVAGDADTMAAASDRAEMLEKYPLATDAGRRAVALFAEAGDVRSQRTLAGAVRRRRALVDGGVPVEAATVEPAAPLTAREREIALLALHGSSNREIADRLTVSTRTVEGHLYRIYAKLGISRREELTPELGPLLETG